MGGAGLPDASHFGNFPHKTHAASAGRDGTSGKAIFEKLTFYPANCQSADQVALQQEEQSHDRDAHQDRHG